MSKTDTENTFVLVKDPKGSKYLCPVNIYMKHLTVDPDEIDECVEEEVAGRYAGKLNRKPS